MTSSNKLERTTITLLLCLALLMFFFSFVRTRGPGGSQPGDGSHVYYTLTTLRSSLSAVATVKPSQDTGASTQLVATAANVSPAQEVPFSLQMASLTPWLIFVALACAGVALLDFVFARKIFAFVSLAGSCLGLAAILHVMKMGSDLDAWTAQLIGNGSLSSADSPLLITRMLLVNSFQIDPGPGLYVLTICLLLVPFLSYTQATPRIRSVIRSEPRIDVVQPIRVRPLNASYPEETGVSVNLSRSGLLVAASNHYYIGMEVYVTRDARSDGPANPEEHGSVVRVEKLDGGKCRIAIRVISAT